MTMAKDPQADSTDFAWPPPDAELDALEPLFIGSGGDGESSTPLTAVQPRAAGRRSTLRIALMLSPYVAAIAIGATLGERQARLSKLPVLPMSPSFVVHERVAHATETPRATPAPPPASLSQPVTPARPRPDVAPATAFVSHPPTPTASRDEAPPATVLSVSGLSVPGLAAAAPPPPAEPPLDDVGRVATSPESVFDVATPMAPPVAAPATTVHSPSITNDQAAIRHTLQRYEDAYEHLDAPAAAAVWPSIDVSALSHAFAGLKTQLLQFDRCDLDVGYESATAVCSGSTHIVRKIGKPEPLIEPLRWTFHLKRTDTADWKIESVATAR